MVFIFVLAIDHALMCHASLLFTCQDMRKKGLVINFPLAWHIFWRLRYIYIGLVAFHRRVKRNEEADPAVCSVFLSEVVRLSITQWS